MNHFCRISSIQAKMSCLSHIFATGNLFLPTRTCRAAQASWLDNPRRATAVTTKRAMNIQTRARVFQNPVQSRKDTKIVFARTIVQNAPVNVLDVRRTYNHGQSIVGLCVARRGVYGAHTAEHMRETTPTHPVHIKSRTQTTPDQRTHESARQASFRWKHLKVRAFVRVYNLDFHGSKHRSRERSPLESTAS